MASLRQSAKVLKLNNNLLSLNREIHMCETRNPMETRWKPHGNPMETPWKPDGNPTETRWKPDLN